ncbi:MAG: response regulator [Phycisphaerae bacterium]|jgi:CheY-like chemotaxis protein
MSENASEAGYRHTVLLAEDNPQHLELLEAYMEEMPEVRVVTARNGQEALAQIQATSPDLVLLDIMMPKVSGFEVCNRIKSDPKTRDTIVVMVTALNETADVERAAECGTDDYLAKPVDRKALLELVQNLLVTKGRGSGP